jgi:DNA-binding transcriptional regulator GbsR (MarR family)
MNIEDAKKRFIQIWGTVGVEWGINRTMAHVHALLLISEEALSAEEIMKALNISRGNANMNLRELINWGLVVRENRLGERKEYFQAKKDIWVVAQHIVAERKKRELDPVLSMLAELEKQVLAKSANKDSKSFIKLLSDIQGLGRKGGMLLDLVIKLDQSTFFKPLISFLKK